MTLIFDLLTSKSIGVFCSPLVVTIQNFIAKASRVLEISPGNESVTDGQTDGQTDGRTDGQT